VTNRKVYIHEFIDIIGHNRAKYMHHMTANWSPIGQEERDQLCYGVWGVVGTTATWPQVVNIWEEDGLDGLASSFRHELSHATLQDPKLAKWWADAAGLRRSGTDRVLHPAPWTRTIQELCAQGIRGEAYAHEQIRVPRGTASSFLDAAAERATQPYGAHGWELIGAWETAMIDESECFLLWALPTWESWAGLEHAERSDSPVRAWRRWVYEHSESWRRFLMVDAPLSPLRTGRQPSRADRVDWDESPAH
jgi:hypothetical protein